MSHDVLSAYPTQCFHNVFAMAALRGGGNLTENQTKSFSKDCIIYAINIDPSP